MVALSRDKKSTDLWEICYNVLQKLPKPWSKVRALAGWLQWFFIFSVSAVAAEVKRDELSNELMLEATFVSTIIAANIKYNNRQQLCWYLLLAF